MGVQHRRKSTLLPPPYRPQSQELTTPPSTSQPVPPPAGLVLSSPDTSKLTDQKSCHSPHPSISSSFCRFFSRPVTRGIHFTDPRKQLYSHGHRQGMGIA